MSRLGGRLATVFCAWLFSSVIGGDLGRAGPRNQEIYV